MSFQLRPASKVEIKARIALVGPSGSGKTYTALEAALALTGDIGKVAVIDTERGSAALYADEFGEFMHGVLDPPYGPDQYLEALQAVAEAGAEAVVIDSLSHAWSGEGGILQQVDDYAARQQGSAGKFGAWREATPNHQRLVNGVIRWPGHVIVTMRAKTAYEVDKDDKGRVEVRKLGLAPEQRAGLEYEFDLVADIDLDHKFVVTKSRCAPLQDAVHTKPDRDWFGPFVEWLNRGDTVQQQVAERLDEIGFTADQQAFICGRYQPGAAGPDELPGAAAGKLLLHLGDDAKLAKIRGAVVSRDDSSGGDGAHDAGETPSEDQAPPVGTEGVSGGSDTDREAAADGDGEGEPEPEGVTEAPSPSPDPDPQPDGEGYDWRAHARKAGVKVGDLVAAMAHDWPDNSQWNRPSRSKDLDDLCADEAMVPIVRAAIDDLTATEGASA